MKRTSNKNQINAASLSLFASLAASTALADVSCKNSDGGFPIVKAFQLSGEANNAAIVLQTDNSKTLLIGEFMTGPTRVGEFVSYTVKDSNEIESSLYVQINYPQGWKACGRGSCIPDLKLTNSTLTHGGQTYALICEKTAF
ncbi:MAG: hypothetical protein RI953_862 [Pseudomonadota bacterium]|jgi:hypothetical protein